MGSLEKADTIWCSLQFISDSRKGFEATYRVHLAEILVRKEAAQCQLWEAALAWAAEQELDEETPATKR